MNTTKYIVRDENGYSTTGYSLDNVWENYKIEWDNCIIEECAFYEVTQIEVVAKIIQKEIPKKK